LISKKLEKKELYSKLYKDNILHIDGSWRSGSIFPFSRIVLCVSNDDLWPSAIAFCIRMVASVIIMPGRSIHEWAGSHPIHDAFMVNQGRKEQSDKPGGGCSYRWHHHELQIHQGQNQRHAVLDQAENRPLKLSRTK
jgi:hypothetical protein